MQYFTQVDCSLLFHGYELHYSTRSKGLMKKLYFIILSRRKIRNISLRFIILRGYGLQELCFVLLTRRKTSFYAKFQVNCSHCLHVHVPVFTWLWPVLTGLSVKLELKGLTRNYITMYYPGRKPVYLQVFEFIGATVSGFHFFMRLRT